MVVIVTVAKAAWKQLRGHHGSSCGLRSRMNYRYLMMSSSSASTSTPTDKHRVNDISQHRFSVAPMMEYTDKHQRTLMRLMSKEAVLYTEMVVANAIIRSDHRESLIEANFDVEEPMVLQLGGSCPQQMYDAVKLAMDYGYQQFNINCGCPSDKVAGSGSFGAALMLQPNLVSDLASAVKDASGKPPSIKCRIGVNDDDSYEQLVAFVVHVSKSSGVKHFVIHARKAVLDKGFSPHDNRSIPPLRYEYVYRLVKDFPDLNFTINGGIHTYEEVLQCLSKGVTGVMVGRSIVNQPFYWNQIDTVLYGKNNDENKCQNRREIIHRYAQYADEIERNEGKRARRALLKPILGLFYGEHNGKLYKSTVDRLIKDTSLPVGEGVMVGAMDCLNKVVLDAEFPKLINIGGSSVTLEKRSIEQARLTKEIYN